MIHVARPEFGKLFVVVYNYSNDAPLIGSKARIELVVNRQIKVAIEVPSFGTGRWWHAFELFPKEGTIRILNTIRDSAPVA